MKEHDDTIRIVRGDYSCEVNLWAAIQTLKIAQIRKLFSLLNTWENDEERQRVKGILSGYAYEAKMDWHDASIAYQNGYCADISHFWVKNNNARLLEKVKDTKKFYEKLMKFMDLLED